MMSDLSSTSSCSSCSSHYSNLTTVLPPHPTHFSYLTSRSSPSFTLLFPFFLFFPPIFYPSPHSPLLAIFLFLPPVPHNYFRSIFHLYFFLSSSPSLCFYSLYFNHNLLFISLVSRSLLLLKFLAHSYYLFLSITSPFSPFIFLYLPILRLSRLFSSRSHFFSFFFLSSFSSPHDFFLLFYCLPHYHH